MGEKKKQILFAPCTGLSLKHVKICFSLKLQSFPYSLIFLITLRLLITSSALFFSCMTGFLISSDINTGIILWLQQFLAIFIKRFIHSVRFWVAIIWQLVIPMIFVLWGLLVAEFVPGTTSDPPNRLISVPNSAPSVENITFFWASFLPEGDNRVFFNVSH